MTSCPRVSRTPVQNASVPCILELLDAQNASVVCILKLLDIQNASVPCILELFDVQNASAACILTLLDIQNACVADRSAPPKKVEGSSEPRTPGSHSSNVISF